MDMHIAMRLGDYPPSDIGVGCKHGIHRQLVLECLLANWERHALLMVSLGCKGHPKGQPPTLVPCEKRVVWQ